MFYFNLEPTRFISVEIDDETKLHPALGRPKVGLDVIDGRKVKVVRAFYLPAEVPAMADFEVMSAPTLLANFFTTDAEYLLVGGWRLRRSEAEELAAKVTVPKAPPSGIKRHP